MTDETIALAQELRALFKQALQRGEIAPEELDPLLWKLQLPKEKIGLVYSRLEDYGVRMRPKRMGDPAAKRIRQLTELLEKAPELLGERETAVLRLRLGLEDGRIHTPDEVAEAFGLTRERVRQIENRALRRIQDPYRRRRIRDYYMMDGNI